MLQSLILYFSNHLTLQLNNTHLLAAFCFALLSCWAVLRLCFLENLRLRRNLGSIPFILYCFLLEGLRVGFRWAFRLWLCAVWFFDLAMAVSGYRPRNGSAVG